MKQHIASIRTNVMVFVALLVLLFATVGAAYLPLGPLHFPVAMTIAAAKAVLIVLFLHARHAQPSAHPGHLCRFALLAGDHDRADLDRLSVARTAHIRQVIADVDAG